MDNNGNGYNNGQPNMEQPYVIKKPVGNNKGTAAMVVGIIAIIFTCVGLGGLPGIIAIILMALAKDENGKKDGKAIAGLVLGIISIVISFFTFAVALGAFAPALIVYINRSRSVEDIQSANIIGSTIESCLEDEEIYSAAQSLDGICIDYDYDTWIDSGNAFEEEVADLVGSDITIKNPKLAYTNFDQKFYVVIDWDNKDVTVYTSGYENPDYEAYPNIGLEIDKYN